MHEIGRPRWSITSLPPKYHETECMPAYVYTHLTLTSNSNVKLLNSREKNWKVIYLSTVSVQISRD